jgi:outer membrane protein
MKKSVFTLIVLTAFSFATKAQTFGFQKQDVILEGAIGVSTSDDKTNEIKMSSVNLSPKAAYFVTDKFAVGLSLSYGQSKNTNYSGTEDSYTKANSSGTGIFGRYYFFSLGQRFKTYTEAGIGYTHTGNESSDGSTVVKTLNVNSYGINAGIGANFFLTPKIAIGYQFANIIGFNSEKSKIPGYKTKAANSFYANLNSFNNFFNSGQFSLTFKL